MEEPQLPPGCDGISGSEAAYDACGVCGGDATDCHVPTVLGRVVAADFDSDTQSYTCMDENDSNIWFPCNRDLHYPGCPTAGQELNWGDSWWNEFPSSSVPVNATAACQTIFGDLQDTWIVDYPEIAVSNRSISVARAVLQEDTTDWEPDAQCPVFACETDWCPEDDAIIPPQQCDGAKTGVEPRVEGIDWSIPNGVTVPENSGFFGKELDDEIPILWAGVDVGWYQLHSQPGEFVADEDGGLAPNFENEKSMDNLQDVLDADTAYWLRIYTAAQDWAPTWITTQCTDVETFEYKEADMLPIWDDCIWFHMRNMYAFVLGDCVRVDDSTGIGTCPTDADGVNLPVDGLNLREDPNFWGIYVPGAFRFAEYSLGAIEAAIEDENYDAYGTSEEFEVLYTEWFRQAVADLIDITGEEYAHKLVFTGEDFPYSIPSRSAEDSDGWNEDVINHLPMEAVATGWSIRNGITENHSSHHYHMPAYGTFVDWSGHVVSDPNWIGYDGKRILATEQECFGLDGGCGSKTYDLDDPVDREAFEYEVMRANLVSLQARMNYMYVKPAVMDEMPAHWNWVKHNLTQNSEDSAEAWVTLGSYRDKFFERDPASHDWFGRPWVQNTEKFLSQKDVCNGGKTRFGTHWVEGDAWESDPTRMTNIEGRRTDRLQSQDFIYFDVDDAFATEPADYDLAVTYIDVGTAEWSIEYEQSGCLISSDAVTNTDSTGTFTVWFHLDQATFNDVLPGGNDIRIYNGGQEDIEIRMLRLVRR